MDDNEYEEEKDDLSFLLGGLDVTALQEADWDTQPPSSPTHASNTTSEGSTNDHKVAACSVASSRKSVPEKLWQELLTRAHTICPSTGVVQPPRVRIVDMSHLQKGFGLVATQRFQKGQVILTEKAAVATQIPQLMVEKKNTTATTGAKDPWRNDLFSVRACQHCFRSMEPISSLQVDGTHTLPLPELWPVKEYNDDCEDENNCKDEDQSDAGTFLRVEPTSGAAQCRHCQALFCNRYCHRNHLQQYGSCCTLTEVVKTVRDWSANKKEKDHENDHFEVQPALLLATRAFAMLRHQHRQQLCDKSSILYCLEGLCGESSDITPLEIGELVDQDKYSIFSLYSSLVRVLGLSAQEQKQFSSKFLEQLAAIAARNTHSIATQNPFQSYYNTLLRRVGRGSEKHTEIKYQVAMALGAPDGELHRGMDELVAKKCCVQPLMGIFPLTARSNHSCKPNAAVQNQQYIDCYIDLVAQREILEGEEVTTSYIPTIQRKHRRQVLLAGKYLFNCRCELCSSGF